MAKSAGFGRGNLYRIGDMCVGSFVDFFGFLLLGPSSPSASLFLSVLGRLTLAISRINSLREAAYGFLFPLLARSDAGSSSIGIQWRRHSRHVRMIVIYTGLRKGCGGRA